MKKSFWIAFTAIVAALVGSAFMAPGPTIAAYVAIVGVLTIILRGPGETGDWVAALQNAVIWPWTLAILIERIYDEIRGS